MTNITVESQREVLPKWTNIDRLRELLTPTEKTIAYDSIDKILSELRDQLNKLKEDDPQREEIASLIKYIENNLGMYKSLYEYVENHARYVFRGEPSSIAVEGSIVTRIHDLRRKKGKSSLDYSDIPELISLIRETLSFVKYKEWEQYKYVPFVETKEEDVAEGVTEEEISEFFPRNELEEVEIRVIIDQVLENFQRKSNLHREIVQYLPFSELWRVPGKEDEIEIDPKPIFGRIEKKYASEGKSLSEVFGFDVTEDKIKELIEEFFSDLREALS